MKRCAGTLPSAGAGGTIFHSSFINGHFPFANKSSDADTEYLSDGLAESLIYRLSQLPNLKVSPTSSVFRYKGKETDPVKVGQELEVSTVLSERITQRGDNLTISAELVDVRNNKLLWGEQSQISEKVTSTRANMTEPFNNCKRHWRWIRALPLDIIDWV